MNRLLVQVAAIMTVGAVAAVSEAAAASDRPNVVLIVSDDHAWTDYSWMGHPHVRTPNIDRLAAESLAFTRGYVPSSLCCPSLATMITGLYPHQHGITGNDPPNPRKLPMAKFHQSSEFQTGRERMNELLAQSPTLPRTLVASGYLALQTGKWWQGHYRHGGFTHGMTQGNRHGDQGLAIGRETMKPIDDFLATAEAGRQPFFIWYAPMMPHLPHTPPDRLLKKYIPLAPHPRVARYWAMIEWFDETVGQLLSRLSERGHADNTIVIYLADNGWITDPSTGRDAPKSKQSPYDGGLRTPILIRWPSHVQPGRTDELASSIDLAPTLLAAVGLEPDRSLPGINLLDRQARQARDAIFGECFTHDIVDFADPAASLRWRWIVSGQWKLIVPAMQNEPQAETELYDLEQDPFETNNLADAHPQRLAEMQAALDAWWPGQIASSSDDIKP